MANLSSVLSSALSSALSTALSGALSVGSVFANALGELVGETRCASCDVPVSGSRVLFCPPCAASVERVDFLEEREGEGDGDGDGDGDGGRLPRSIHRCAAAFEYGGAITTAITRLKYEDRPDLAARLGRAMLASAQRMYGDEHRDRERERRTREDAHHRPLDLIVPVPLHPRRLADRGYNQAALLACPIARALGVKLAPRALVRLRDTPRQASLERHARLTNLRGAFCAREAAARGTIARSTRVLLIDDVRTTGSTLEACANALHEVGVRDVRVLVLARA